MIQFRQGQGIYKLDGNIYEGEWVLDKMHGHGKFAHACNSSNIEKNGSSELVGAGLFKFMGGDSYDVRQKHFHRWLKTCFASK